MARSIILSQSELRQIVQHVGVDALMDRMIQRLTTVLEHYDPAEYTTPIRSGFNYEKPVTGLLEWMPTRHEAGTASVKIVGYHPENPARRGLPTILSTIASFDTRTGRLQGIVDATFLTALRTGAASAVATRVLASPRSRRLGLIGAGAQAIAQLHALSRVLEIDEVLAYDADPRVAQSFGQRVESLRLSRPSIRMTTAAEVAASSDIVCTSTSVDVGAGPVLDDTDVRPWLHVNAVGSDFPGKIELPTSLLRRALVSPDFREQAILEGECQQLDPSEIGPDLAEIVQNAASLQQAREGLTVFDSTGWALEDHLAVQMLLEYGADLGLGSEIEIESIPDDPLNPYSLGTDESIVSIASVSTARSDSAGTS